MIALLVTLRSIYRKQALVTTHKQSLKKNQKERRTQFRKHQNQSNIPCNIKQFLTVPKLCEFGLIRKFRSSALICKKESTQTELQNSSYDQTKFKLKSDLIQILNFQKHV